MNISHSYWHYFVTATQDHGLEIEKFRRTKFDYFVGDGTVGDSQNVFESKMCDIFDEILRWSVLCI